MSVRRSSSIFRFLQIQIAISPWEKSKVGRNAERMKSLVPSDRLTGQDAEVISELGVIRPLSKQNGSSSYNLLRMGPHVGLQLLRVPMLLNLPCRRFHHIRFHVSHVLAAVAGRVHG